MGNILSVVEGQPEKAVHVGITFEVELDNNTEIDSFGRITNVILYRDSTNCYQVVVEVRHELGDMSLRINGGSLTFVNYITNESTVIGPNGWGIYEVSGDYHVACYHNLQEYVFDDSDWFIDGQAIIDADKAQDYTTMLKLIRGQKKCCKGATSKKTSNGTTTIVNEEWKWWLIIPAIVLAVLFFFWLIRQS